MTTQHAQAIWIDVPGTEQVVVDVELDTVGKRVLVTPTTIREMADAVLVASIADDDENEHFASAISRAPLDATGETRLRDVTELGGGFDRWIEMIVEPEPVHQAALVAAAKQDISTQEQAPGRYVAPVIGESHYRIVDAGPWLLSWHDTAEAAGQLLASATTLGSAISELERVSGAKVVIQEETVAAAVAKYLEQPSSEAAGRALTMDDRVDFAIDELASERQIRRLEPVSWTDAAELGYIALELEQLVAKVRAMRAVRSA